MKSGTEIMLHGQVEEAKAAHLELLHAAEFAADVIQGTYDGRPTPVANLEPWARDVVTRLRMAIGRCTRWSSTLPQPEKASR